MKTYIFFEGTYDDVTVLDVVSEQDVETYIDVKSKELEVTLSKKMNEWVSPNKVMKIHSPVQRYRDDGAFGVRATVSTDGRPTPTVWSEDIDYEVKELWKA